MKSDEIHNFRDFCLLMLLKRREHFWEISLESCNVDSSIKKPGFQPKKWRLEALKSQRRPCFREQVSNETVIFRSLWTEKAILNYFVLFSKHFGRTVESL